MIPIRVKRKATIFYVDSSWHWKKISKRMYCCKREPRNDRKISMLQYCPKDFVQDCLNPSFLKKVFFFNFSFFPFFKAFWSKVGDHMQ